MCVVKWSVSLFGYSEYSSTSDVKIELYHRLARPEKKSKTLKDSALFFPATTAQLQIRDTFTSHSREPSLPELVFEDDRPGKVGNHINPNYTWLAFDPLH